jgi:hypothetical protein
VVNQQDTGVTAEEAAALAPQEGLSPCGSQAEPPAANAGCELQGILGSAGAALAPVGSRVTCNPPPVDTDEDWLALCIGNTTELMRSHGFKQDGSPQFYTGNDNGGFRSWRRGELNVVTTESNEFFWRFITATDLAKRFNLLAKADRIALFQAVLYGVRSENLEPAPFISTVIP